MVKKGQASKASIAEMLTVPAIVTHVNDVLDVQNDPIGVGAWWTQTNGRLGGARPIELLGTPRQMEVWHAADGLIEPTG